MPSFISSSDRSMSRDRHTKVIFLGLMSGLFLIGATENYIRFKGGEPDVRDTAELWASQRARVSSIGDDALILVGSSRIQLDLDLDTLATSTGKRPVQLAIDGSPFIDVLENLANDRNLAGTVLVSTTLPKLAGGGNAQREKKWINIYEKEYKNLWFPQKEQILKAKLQSVSALYANILPLDKLVPRLLASEKLQNIYLKTQPSRERNADYSLVKMPDFYLQRVERNLGYPLPAEAYESYESYQRTVIRIANENYKEFNADPLRFNRVKSAIKKLQQRDVIVVIARFPMSGLVEGISDIRFPKDIWDKVISDLDVISIDCRDYAQLAYQLPDGSHLDITQKPDFTHKFSEILMQEINPDHS